MNFNKLRDGVGYTIHQGPGGFYLEVDAGADAGALDFPFKVRTKKGTSGYDVYVRPGTVNNFVPKIGSTYLDAETPPKLNFTSVSSSGKKIVALKVTKDSKIFFPGTSEIVLLDNEEALENSDTIGYLQLASITCSTTGGTLKVKTINQYAYASQVVFRTKLGSTSAYWSFSSR